jgi:hypothetical protein
VHAFHEYKTDRVDTSVGKRGNESCGGAPSGDETFEVWLDHLDELASIPRRGFHSAFQEGDAGGALGMRPWTSIHEGISSSSASPFNLLFVFGGMQMTTVEESESSVTAMDSDACFQSNSRVLNAFRETLPSPTSTDAAVQHQHARHQPHRVLVISRSGTWWRRWLDEKVGPERQRRSLFGMFPIARVVSRKSISNVVLKRTSRNRWLLWRPSSTAVSSMLQRRIHALVFAAGGS